MDSRFEKVSRTKVDALMAVLREAINASELVNLPHPIPHNQSGIDHPLWPYVSLFARDAATSHGDRVDWILKQLAQFTHGDSAKVYERDNLFGLYASLIHFTNLLSMKDGKFFKDDVPDKSLVEVVASFASREIFLPLLRATNETKVSPHLWFGFCKSTHLEGFLANAIAIGEAMVVPAHPPELIPYIREGTPSSIAYDLKGLWTSNAPTTIEQMDDLCEAWVKAKKAAQIKEKRRAKGAKVRPNLVLELIVNRWLSDALWCRTTASIVTRYCGYLSVSTGEQHEAACNQFDQEVSRLGIGPFRHSEHDQMIEEIEKCHLAKLGK